MGFGGRLSNKLTRSFRATLYSLGVESMLYKIQSGKDVVLMFHNVFPKTENDIHFRNIGKHDFFKSLNYLKKKYQIVELAELMETKSGQNRIAITFDDGLINNLKYALPVLEELEIPATFFITTSWIHGQNILWPDELMLLLKRAGDEVSFQGEKFKRVFANQFRSESSGKKLELVLLESSQVLIDAFLIELRRKTSYEPACDFVNEDYWRMMKGEEIKILAASNWVNIGSHGVTHRNLLKLSHEAMIDELVSSKKYLEQVTKDSIKSIAYPFGLYNGDVLEAANEAGYKYHLLVDEISDVPLRNLHTRERMGLYNDLSLVEQLHQINQRFE